MLIYKSRQVCSWSRHWNTGKIVNEDLRLMALLNILVYPDPRLRQKAQPVETVDNSVRELVNNMAETMYQAPGIGLAATQVNVTKRIVVIDHSEERNDLRVFINPTITAREGEVETEEGCLSVPGIVAPVTRSEKITVEATDIEGNNYEVKATGIFAICIQHEIDHLDGKVFVDYLTRLKRIRIRKQLLKNNGSTTGISSGDATIAL